MNKCANSSKEIIDRQKELLPALGETIGLRLRLESFKRELSHMFTGFSSDVYFYTQASQDVEDFLSNRHVFSPFSNHISESFQLSRLREINCNIKKLLELLIKNRSDDEGAPELSELEESDAFNFFLGDESITLTEFRSFKALEKEISLLSNVHDIEEHHDTYLKVIAYIDLLILITKKIEGNVGDWLYNLFYTGSENKSIDELLNRNFVRSFKMLLSKRKSVEYTLYKVHAIDIVIKHALCQHNLMGEMNENRVFHKENEIALEIFSNVVGVYYQGMLQIRINSVLEMMRDDLDYIIRNEKEVLFGTPQSLSGLLGLINYDSSKIIQSFMQNGALDIKKVLKLYKGVIGELKYLLEEELDKKEQEDLINNEEHTLIIKSYRSNLIEEAQSIRSINNELVGIDSYFRYYGSHEGESISREVKVEYDHLSNRVYVIENDLVDGERRRFFVLEAHKLFYEENIINHILSLEFTEMKANVLIDRLSRLRHKNFTQGISLPKSLWKLMRNNRRGDFDEYFNK